MSFVARGITQVVWRPNYTLVLESVDGLSLDADGEPHTLIATLTNTSTGAPIPNKKLLLTTSPAGEVGFGKVKITDSTGRVTFSVSDDDSESVVYTCSLLPERVIQDSITIVWGGTEVEVLAQGYTPTDFPTHYGSPYTITFIVVRHDDEVTPVEGVTVTFTTSPAGHDGDGVVAGPSDVNGLLTLIVNEPSGPPSTNIQYGAQSVDPPFTLFGIGLSGYQLLQWDT